MSASRRSRARLLVIVAGVLGSVLPFAVNTESSAHADASLLGGGSSYAALAFGQWGADVAKKPYELFFNYGSSGSSAGRLGYTNGDLDFAASDIPFQPPDLSALARQSDRTDQNFVYVPVIAGGLAFMYNLVDQSGTQVTSLNLTRNAVCRIFTEPNMYWDDTEIQSANPSIAMPHELVRPVTRADGSGTSYVLSEYCITVEPALWTAFVARSAGDSTVDNEFRAGHPSSTWPVGWGVAIAMANGDGVASAVAGSNGLYAITYGEPGAALLKGFPNASVQNSQGVFTQPTEEAASIALGYATRRDDGTFQLDYDGPDARAYFPSTYSYVIAQTTGFPTDKGLTLAKVLCYAITKGQEKMPKLGYARLSVPLVEANRCAIISPEIVTSSVSNSVCQRAISFRSARNR